MNKNAVLPVDIKNLDTKIADQVAQHYVLQEIYLVDAKISRDPFAISPENLTLKHKCSVDSLNMPDSDSGKYIVLCNFRVVAINGQNLSKPIMKIEASFCTSYVKRTDYDDSPETLLAYVEYLMTINPISDAWPYWREFVQNMSSRMGFPALTVPLLEIVPKKTATQKAKSQPVKNKSTRRKKVSA